MSVQVTLSGEGLSTAIKLERGLSDRRGMHARMAAEGEIFLKDRGGAIATGKHATADRLGGRRSGHLEDAYQGIQGEHDEGAARLLVPRKTRLRAAFGAHKIKPGAGKKYLTLPVAGDAYGKRAGEFPEGELFPVRVGPRKTLVLAREDATGGGIETMYLLTTEVDVSEDKSLIPFDELIEVASDTAEEWMDEIIEGGLA